MKIEIRQGTIDEVVLLSKEIPEFHDPYGPTEYQRRLNGEHLLLVAKAAERLAGFKVGYDRFGDGKTFYSWMGGVLPQYRGKGIASALQKRFETWCRERGIEMIRFKTFNGHRAMIRFALCHDFYIYRFEAADLPQRGKIYLEKRL